MTLIETLYLIYDNILWCGLDIQKFINCRHKSSTECVVDNRLLNPNYISDITTKDGFVLRANTNIRFLFDIEDCYHFYDITKEDIVLDIGSNIGCFSIAVSQLAKKVYSVEPLLADELRYNVGRNGIANITVIESALGDGEQSTVSWGGEIRSIQSRTLAQLVAVCGGHVDFLKCDCEGGEWCIHPEELKGIRRIEMELHYFRGLKPNPDLIKYIEEHYNTVIEDVGVYATKILHAELK